MECADFERLAATRDAPFYVYDWDAVAERVGWLRAAFENFRILYSMKCNPCEALCRKLAQQGLGVDAASATEVLRARDLGLPRDMILYSAPGKSAADLVMALPFCTIIADSYGELQELDDLCAARGVTATVGLRVSPDMAYGPGPLPDILPGRPDKFGEDEESLGRHAVFLRGLPHLRIAGIHVYMRSQVLDAAALCAGFRRVVEVAAFWRRELGLPLDFVNVGGGLGIPCAASQRPVDLETLCAGAAGLVRELRRHIAEPVRLYMESGRFLVGEAGFFVTRIRDIKKSRGTTFVLAPGLFNHFFRASFAGLMADLPLPVTYAGPLEPLWSGPGLLKPRICGAAAPERVVTLCGTLCTAQDIALRDVRLKNIVKGNVLVFPHAGAYAASLSPHGFGGHPPVGELLWHGAAVG